MSLLRWMLGPILSLFQSQSPLLSVPRVPPSLHPGLSPITPSAFPAFLGDPGDPSLPDIPHLEGASTAFPAITGAQKAAAKDTLAICYLPAVTSTLIRELSAYFRI